MKTKKLTPKQKLFIDEYISTGDLGKSYHKIYNMDNLSYCYRAAWGIESFKSTQRNDSIKNQYCEDNNIPLIRIKYDIDDIEEYLEQELDTLL